MSDIVTLYTTVSDIEEAKRIASALLEERLVACANIIPGGRSLYVWEGEVADDPELFVLFKTRRPLAAAAKARIAELHSYDVPCIAIWPWADGHAPYMQWVESETAAGSDRS